MSEVIQTKYLKFFADSIQGSHYIACEYSCSIVCCVILLCKQDYFLPAIMFCVLFVICTEFYMFIFANAVTVLSIGMRIHFLASGQCRNCWYGLSRRTFTESLQVEKPPSSKCQHESAHLLEVKFLVRRMISCHCHPLISNQLLSLLT